jgi:hypothetical protein
MVMMTCPTTGEAVPTGIGMDAETFKSADLSSNSSGCSACGQSHTWDKGEAYLNS